MTGYLAWTAVAAFVVHLLLLVRAVRHDGYGRRPPPRSERHWDEWIGDAR